MKKFGEFCKKHKKLVIVLAIVLVIAIVVIVGAVRAKKAAEAMANQVETYTVEKRDLLSTVTASGKVASVESRDIVVSSANGLEITAINYQVGDQVSEGDVLASFDTSELEHDLEDAETNVNASEGQAGNNVKSSSISLNEATTEQALDTTRQAADTAKATSKYNSAVSDRDTAASELQAAKDSIDKQQEYYNEHMSQYNSLKTQVENYEANIKKKDELASKYAAKQTEIDNFLDNLDSALVSKTGKKASNYSIDGGSTPTATDLVAADSKCVTELGVMCADLESYRSQWAAISGSTSEYDALVTKMNEAYAAAQTDLSNKASAEATKTTKEAELKSAESALDSASTALESQKRTEQDTLRKDANSVANSQLTLSNSQLSASTAGLSSEKQVRQLETQLEDCDLKAPIAGIITAINFKEGDNYNSGQAILTIEDNSSYIITADIDEYSINKIEVGQRVIFKTNGTGDTEMEGIVTEVAPRATTSTTTSGTSTTSTVNYKVKIAINSDISDLRMDMTAKLNIVTDEVDGALSVPQSAVVTDEDGSTYLIKEDGSRLPVTLGTSTDYYVEVSGEGLSEGMTLCMPVSEDASDIESIMLNAGPTGGM